MMTDSPDSTLSQSTGTASSQPTEMPSLGMTGVPASHPGEAPISRSADATTSQSTVASATQTWRTRRTRISAFTCAVAAILLVFALQGCASGDTAQDESSSTTTTTSSETDDSSTSSDASSTDTSEDTTSTTSATAPTKDDITIDQTLTNSEDGGHAITADGTSDSYSNTQVTKTGDSSDEDADFYGDNAAIFATNGATLTLSDMIIQTDGSHANAVFSYGSGTVVDISDSVIETTGNNSGGLMTTGGGTTNATNLSIYTTGNSSAAIRSDRGGGTVNVDGGSYTTDGTGSPVIYSTADITVSNALLTSTASQGVVVEGSNSVTLNNTDLVASNTTKNSSKSDYYQAIMIYQSMSGDASEGASSFTATGGTITNANGDIFFVNNTTTTITLTGVDITNNDTSGVFLRAAAAGWGKTGSNGGNVTLYANDQDIQGDMLVDDVSSLNAYLSDGSAFSGAINPSGQQGSVYVELSDGATWTLTGDSYVTSLTCDANSIDLNGHTLYVNGVAYTEGTASTGTAV